jgi:hypothetical protein
VVNDHKSLLLALQSRLGVSDASFGCPLLLGVTTKRQPQGILRVTVSSVGRPRLARRMSI